MKLLDLYNRVIETTGLDVMTLESIQAAVANCMADLTSRGYQCFKEISLSELKEADNKYMTDCATFSRAVDNNKLNIISVGETKLQFRMPTDIRKTLYCKIYFAKQSCKATRYSVSNPRIDCKYSNGQFESEIDKKSLAIFYTKNDKVYVEWRRELGPVLDIQYGYYQKLSAPKIDTNIEDVKALRDVEIDIRPEFEDALVFYAAFFYYSRYIKDTDKITLYNNHYKYYVEDIIHELSYEDDFFEEDAVITTEEEE